MNVTLLGIVTDVRALQFKKALSPIVVTPLPKNTDNRQQQSLKAELPIDVTLLGMLMEILHLKDAVA